MNAPISTTDTYAAPTPGASTFATSRPQNRLRTLWSAIGTNPKVLFGLSTVVLFFLVALFGPLFVRTDPNAFSSDILSPPSAAHWLGTTQTGQDIFAQLIYGTRVSILSGLATGLLVTILSVTIGISSGYLGGFVDDVLSLFINVFLVLPALPLAIVLAAYFPFKGPLTVSLVITVTSWAWGARVLRAQTMSMSRREFVYAARAGGESGLRIIFFEILPNEIAVVAAGFVGTVIFVILAEAGLEFLGLGNPTVVSWGTMFYWAQNNDALLLGAWWWFLPPGLCIAGLGAALAFINFGIDELANPRLRNEGRRLRSLQRKKALA
ncbi:MAG TPA: ABC transporter permease [Ktedonobacteraceae bacterium]|nr:ABC transporter permease [Ktedonobacteraceae bacterium]